MGKWICDEDKCSSSCDLYGFGHVDTFDGKIYEFEASACSYYLVQVRSNGINEVMLCDNQPHCGLVS